MGVVGVSPQHTSSLADRVSCKARCLPFNFLVIPVGSTLSRSTPWQPLIDKFQNKLSNWKTSTLSVVGRLIMCKTVLGSLGNYIFSLFKAPDCVINKLENLRRKFFLGGIREKKMTWIAWNTTISSKEQGGALLAKWWCKIKIDNSSLWVAVIKAIHGHVRLSQGDPMLSKKRGTWGSIISIRKMVLNCDVDLSSLFSIN